MPSASRYILPTILGLACTAGPVSAQDTEVTTWQPVDQTVSDLDLRAVSTRRVEQGLNVYGQTGSLYRRSDSGMALPGQPLSQQYLLRKPGFTAYLDQPDYLVIDRQGELNLNVSPSADGHFLDIIPPNTVFDLAYRPAVPVPYYDPLYDMGLGNTRMHMRIDGLIDGQVPDHSAVRMLASPPEAFRLPPHLMKQREERRAEAEAEAAGRATDEREEVEQDGAEADTPAP